MTDVSTKRVKKIMASSARFDCKKRFACLQDVLVLTQPLTPIDQISLEDKYNDWGDAWPWNY
jgi:hypothetical protein